jgi:alkaline phosphatase D
MIDNPAERSITMNRREFLKTAGIGGAAFICGLTPQTSLGYKATIKGYLESNLSLLNLWTRVPEAVNARYTAIYNTLATSPMAGFADVANNKALQTLFQEQNVLLLGGPMLGCVSSDGARIWVRTVRPSQVALQVEIDGTIRTFGPVRSTLESDLTAIVPVTGLRPNTTTLYRILIDGQTASIPEHAAITTAPEGNEVATRIAFGTCPHRWGLGHIRQSDQIRRRKPVAMLMYGDVAVQDRNNHLGMHRADYALRDLHPAWQNLVSTIPIYASWDDHDYFHNDKSGIPKGYTDQDRRGVRKVFTQAWNNSAYGFGDDAGGIFHRTRIGVCDVVMTDNRYFRSKEAKRYPFLGSAQMQWLKETLLACQGPFIIVTCGTMWSDYVSNGKDSWGKWDPEGRDEILDFIEQHRIAGVLLLSGDRHGTRVFRLPRPSGYQFYEFEPASLGGRTGPAIRNPKWTTQLYGNADVFAFGEFTFDASVADPTVTYQIIEDTGNVLYELQLTRSRLTPKG